MAELPLDRDERLALKAQSHHLDPVVLLGAAGLSEAVMREIDRALTAHGLIKVRVPGDDRDEREQMFTRIADTLGAARVAGIGKLLVLYRPVPEQKAAERRADRPTAGPPRSGRPAGARAKGARPKTARPGGTGRPVRRS